MAGNRAAHGSCGVCAKGAGVNRISFCVEDCCCHARLKQRYIAPLRRIVEMTIFARTLKFCRHRTLLSADRHYFSSVAARLPFPTLRFPRVWGIWFPKKTIVYLKFYTGAHSYQETDRVLYFPKRCLPGGNFEQEQSGDATQRQRQQCVPFIATRKAER